MVASWPKWAQRHIVLGLDLQGGSHLLLEVDTKAVRKEMLENLRDDVRRVLREARIGYTGLVVRGNSVEVHIREKATTRARRCTKLRTLAQPLGGILSATGHNNIDITAMTATLPADRDRPGDPRAGAPGGRPVDPDHRAAHQRARHRRAADPARGQRPHPGAGAGPAGPDPAQGSCSARPPSSTSAWSTPRSRRSRPQQGHLPPDDEILLRHRARRSEPYVVEKRILVSGADLTDAQPGFDPRTSEPIVTFRFNTSGARKFARGDRSRMSASPSPSCSTTR